MNMMRKWFGFCGLVILVGAMLWFLFAAPVTTDARGRHKTLTPRVVTISPGATGTLQTRTPTARWTPMVITIVPGPTFTLPTKTPPCSRSYCK